MIATRRDVTRLEALRWNPKWTDGDRAKVAQCLAEYRPAFLYTVPSGTYISGRGPNGEPLFWISKGFLSEVYPDGTGERLRELLSTHVAQGPRTATPGQAAGVCPECWMERSVTGACGCEEAL